jgi:hypothetical protein
VVVEELKTQFDVSAFPIEQLAATHSTVTRLTQVGYGLHRNTNTDDERIQFARTVRSEVLEKI